jgi:branched-chain amino acid aminotransferase
MAELGMKCEEANLTRYDIWTADEMFLTGTAAEVIPVVEVDERRTIGDGQVGEATTALRAAFQEVARQRGTKI